MCADFLAGRGEESSPSEILMVIHPLVHLLSPEYRDSIPSPSGEGNCRPREKFCV
jgi:hypothetical protein